MAHDLIVGIDLGTTNSLVAYMDGDTPRVIPDREGRNLLPSVVSFAAEGIVVGEAAKRQLLFRPEKTVYSVKRLMGRGYEDVKGELRFFPFQIVPMEQELVRIRIGEREVTPPEVSALILNELRRRAEEHLGQEVRRAVVTVPAYFNDSQRQATRDAGKIAGLEILRIVNEPTAACLAYGLQKKKQGMIAVYDLGGGTFDISILKVKDGIFEVLATNGNTHLGGDDFDQRLMELILREIREQFGVDLVGNPEAVQTVRLEAEQAKCRLSSEAVTEMALSFPGDLVKYRRQLSRKEMESLVEDLVEQTVAPCQTALADAGLDAAQVDEVVLVGGATRTPLVRQRVREFFGKVPHAELDPDEVVALGAAVQAHILAGKITEMLLLDVNPLSLGIETLGGVISVLIPRNTTIPHAAKEQFTTSVDGQTVVDLHVLQGERELVKDCRSLARFELRGIPPMPAGIPRIEVTFLIDANGILNVAAKELRSVTEASVEVKPSYGLTDAEVERMIEESVKFAEADVRARLLVEARNEADQVIRATEKALSDGAPLISMEEMAAIHSALAALKTARDTDDLDLLRERLESLNGATKHLAQLLIDNALKEAFANKRIDEVVERT